jgi:hypothetical protein
MADNRSKRQKLEAVINGRGVTDGERENAKRLLAKMKPEPNAASGLRDIIDKDARRRSAPASRPVWDRPPDPVYDFNFNINYNEFRSKYWGDFTSRPFTDNWESTWQREQRQRDEALREKLAQMTPEEIIELFNRTFGNTQAQQRSAHDLGVHAWVPIGTNVYGNEIARCSICGEYNPARPRKKTHDKDNMEDHDWEDDHRFPEKGPDVTMWTQTCRGCRLRRIDPKQPPLWADYDKEP